MSNIERIMEQLESTHADMGELLRRLKHGLATAPAEHAVPEKPTTRVFTREYLRNKRGLPETAVSDILIETKGAVQTWDCVFTMDDLPPGYGWRARYQCDDFEYPWSFEELITCTLVKLTPVRVEQWLPAELPEAHGPIQR